MTRCDLVLLKVSCESEKWSSGKIKVLFKEKSKTKDQTPTFRDLFYSTLKMSFNQKSDLILSKHHQNPSSLCVVIIFSSLLV